MVGGWLEGRIAVCTTDKRFTTELKAGCERKPTAQKEKIISEQKAAGEKAPCGIEI